MQPLQDDFRDPAAKDNSITNAATARSNLDAAIAIGSAETELQNTIELRATASEIVAPTPQQKKLILNRKWKQPKSERSFFCHMYAIRSWFSPPARWGLLDFMSVACSSSPPPLLSSPPPPAQPRPSTHSGLCRTSTTTIHAQCSLPDLNHDHHRQCSLPDLNRGYPRPVFPAGPQPRPSTPSVPCRTSTASIHAKCSLPDLM